MGKIMAEFSIRLVFLSFALMCMGTASGWAITRGLSGDIAANGFLGVALPLVAAVVLVQAALYLYSKDRLYRRLLFIAAFGLCLVWFMLCLLLPLLWMDEIGVFVRGALVILILVLAAGNIVKSFAVFKEKWEQKGQRAFELAFDGNANAVNWEKVAEPLDLSGELCIPGVPKMFKTAIGILIVPAMIAGFSLRDIFPVFSAFAWGIPSAILAGLFFQLVGYSLAKAAVVMNLEKKLGVQIKALA